MLLKCGDNGHLTVCNTVRLHNTQPLLPPVCLSVSRVPFPPGPDTLRCPSSRWPPTGCPPCRQMEAWTDIVMSVNNWEDTQSLHSSRQNEPCPGCWPITRENNCPAGGTETNPDCWHCAPHLLLPFYLTTREGPKEARWWDLGHSHLLYSSCSREKMCLLKYSWSFSLA